MKMSYSDTMTQMPQPLSLLMPITQVSLQSSLKEPPLMPPKQSLYHRAPPRMPRIITHNLIWKQHQSTLVFANFDTFLLEAHQLQLSLTSSLWYHCRPQKENHHPESNASFFATKTSTIASFGVKERATQQITPADMQSPLTNCLHVLEKRQKSTRNSSSFFISQSDLLSRRSVCIKLNSMTDNWNACATL